MLSVFAADIDWRVPDYGYYTAARDDRGGGRATLPAARKLARRCYHTLRELGEDALAPAA